jgi:hypothetical protein
MLQRSINISQQAVIALFESVGFKSEAFAA